MTVARLDSKRRAAWARHCIARTRIARPVAPTTVGPADSTGAPTRESAWCWMALDRHSFGKIGR